MSGSSALHLSQAALNRDDLPEAMRLCRKHLAAFPKDVDATILMGILCARSSAFLAAEQYLKNALGQSPRRIEVYIALSTVLVSLGRPKEGISALREAIGIEPNDPDLHTHLGLTLVELRRFAEASEAFRRALGLAPESLSARRNLAAALRDSGDEVEAVRLLEQITDSNDVQAGDWLNLGQLYTAHGRFTQAVECGRSAVRSSPTNSQAHLLLALALCELGHGKEAEPSLRRALELGPDEPIAHAAFGFWRQEQGRFAEAEAALRRAISLNPRHGFAYYNLFRSRKATEEDLAMLDRMATIAAQSTSLRDRGYIHYALGKAWEDLKEYETAMGNYVFGNRDAYQAWLAHRPWDREAYTVGFDRTIETFDRAKLARRQPGMTDSDVPIVIVGMIRSGTSLVEQVLSSHPQIAGAGELPFWHEYEVEAAQDPAGLGFRYVDRLREIAPDALRVTDKLPHNYAMLGHILSAVPNARVIHVRRDPIDNCLSVYTTAYQRPPVFAHHRANIVFAYREYERMMAHWRSVLLPDRLLEIRYEDLIANREETTREMIAFAGLEWDDACLSHERNDRAVRTPSLWQVRQPIYRTSVDRWRRFEPWIPEFVELGAN